MRGASFILLSRLASAALQAIVMVGLARTSSLQEFGLFSVALAIGAVVSGAVTLGLPTYALRSKDISASKSTLMVASVGQALLVMLAAIAYEAVARFSTSALPWLIAAALYTSSEIVGNIAQSILFSEMRDRGVSLLMLLRRGIPILAILGFGFARLDTFIGFAIASTLTAVASVAFISPTTWDLRGLKQIVIDSRHYWTSGLFAMLQQLDLVLISAISGASAAAGYAAAFRLASPVHIVTSVITSRGMPKIAQSDDAPARIAAEREMKRFGVVYACLTVAASPFAYFLGPIIVGKQFDAYAIVFSILLINSAISVLNQVWSAALFVRGEGRWVARSTTASTLIGLAAVALGACGGGVVPASMGTVSIQVILLTLLMKKSTSRRKSD